MEDRKILIVDFDEESLISLSNLMLEEGFQPVTASDGLSAYEKFKADNFDLVILEPMLPKLHGFELCKRINQDPFKKRPIIVVTGIYREPSCKVEALQVYGASAFFTKPWNKDELRSKILQLLVEGKDTPSEKEIPRAVPARDSGRDEREVAIPRAVPREPKMSQDIDEIEKELQAAVSSVIGVGRKKDTREKKTEPKPDVDKEIEAMLKGAIGELGLEERKKKAQAARPELKIAAELRHVSEPKQVKIEPILKPTPHLPTEPRPEKKEKIPVAKEIKERIPSPDKAGNNIPYSASKVRLDTPKPPFGIAKTLIEIDKIPLDTDRAPFETKRASLEAEKTLVESKSAFFEEFTEPRKKKTTFLLIGGIVAAVFIVSGSTFYILKSKKARQTQQETLSSFQPSLPTEFSTRQNEIMASEAREKESKPEPKKTPAKSASQQPSEQVEQLQPVLPTETPSPQLTVQQPLSNSEPPPPNREQTPPAGTNTQEDVSQQPPASQAAPEKTAPGTLVPVDNVDVGPMISKRVEPKYPSLALNRRQQGTVSVNALIDENGNVIRTEILKGIRNGDLLEKAAEDAIKQWKFKPAQKDGVNVKVWKAFEFNFKVNTPVKE